MKGKILKGRNRKRIFGIAIVMAMLVALLPINSKAAYAASTPEGYESWPTEVHADCQHEEGGNHFYATGNTYIYFGTQSAEGRYFSDGGDFDCYDGSERFVDIECTFSGQTPSEGWYYINLDDYIAYPCSAGGDQELEPSNTPEDYESWPTEVHTGCSHSDASIHFYANGSTYVDEEFGECAEGRGFSSETGPVDCFLGGDDVTPVVLIDGTLSQGWYYWNEETFKMYPCSAGGDQEPEPEPESKYTFQTEYKADFRYYDSTGDWWFGCADDTRTYVICIDVIVAKNALWGHEFCISDLDYDYSCVRDYSTGSRVDKHFKTCDTKWVIDEEGNRILYVDATFEAGVVPALNDEIHWAFSLPKEVVATIDITDIDAPVRGSALDTTAVCDTEGVAVTAPTVRWMIGEKAASGTAQAATIYTAYVELEAKPGYIFGEEIAATICGYEATVTRTDDTHIVVSYTFEATEDFETVTATYVDYSSAVANYNDPDWGMVKGAKFTIEFQDDNVIVIKNWMNQGVDLCIKYDKDGYIESVYNPGAEPTYWAYCDSEYYLYVACKAYGSSNSWVDLTSKILYIQGSWGMTWDVNYCLSWHEHNWSYTVADGQLVAKCSGDGYCTEGSSITLDVTADEINYTGSAVTAPINLEAWTAAGGVTPTIKYVGTGTTSYEESTTGPTDFGTYKAIIIIGDQSVEVAFEVTHNYAEEWSKDETNHWHACTDEGYTDLKNDEAAHSWDDGVVTTEATIEAAGEKTYTCTECEQTQTEAIPQLKGTYDEIETANGKVENITGTDKAPNEKNDLNANVSSDDFAAAIGVTDTEKAEGVNLWLTFTDAEETMSDADKQLIEDAKGNRTVGVLLNISLLKKVGEGTAEAVHDLKAKVTVSFVVPENLRKAGRTYKIVRVHNGETTVIDATYDEATYTLSFETDAFSSYALVYADKSNVPPTGVADYAGYAMGIMLIAMAATAVVAMKSRKKEEI